MSKRMGDIALVGCGMWGKNLLRTLGDRVGMVCDPDPDALQWVLSNWPDIVLVRDLDLVLSEPTIKAVAIASPPDQHFNHALRGLEAGRHVFVEKPMAMTVAQGETLARLAEDRGVVLMVGHLMRYHPGFRKLQQIVAEGELGRLRYIHTVRGKLGGLRREPDVLWSFAPHDISMILALVGRMPEYVQALGGAYLRDGVPDVTATDLDFGDVQANLFVNWLHPFKEQRLVVVGDEGIAVFRDGAGEDTLTVYPYRVANGEPIGEEPRRVEIVGLNAEPLAVEMACFLEYIDNGMDPLTNAAEGLRVLRVLCAAQEAMRRGVGCELQEAQGEQLTWLPDNWDWMTWDGLVTEAEPHPPGVKIHPLAEVETDDMGEGTTIWRWSHVMPGAKIGRNVMIGQGCFIGRNVVIGDGCRIQNGAQLFEGVTLGRNVFVGPGVVFTNDRWPVSFHESRPFEETDVRCGAVLGANATIRCGVTIGQGVMVGAGAVVTRDIERGVTVVGNPARVLA